MEQAPDKQISSKQEQVTKGLLSLGSGLVLLGFAIFGILFACVILYALFAFFF